MQWYSEQMRKLRWPRKILPEKTPRKIFLSTPIFFPYYFTALVIWMPVLVKKGVQNCANDSRDGGKYSKQPRLRLWIRPSWNSILTFVMQVCIHCMLQCSIEMLTPVPWKFTLAIYLYHVDTFEEPYIYQESGASYAATRWKGQKFIYLFWKPDKLQAYPCSRYCSVIGSTDWDIRAEFSDHDKCSPPQSKLIDVLEFGQFYQCNTKNRLSKLSWNLFSGMCPSGRICYSLRKCNLLWKI